MIDTLKLDVNKVWEVLKYNAQQPIIFSSGLFLVLFFFFIFFYQLVNRNNLGKFLYVTAFSLYFYYKSSGMYVLLLVFTSFADFLLGLAIFRAHSVWKKRLFLVLSILSTLGVLFYFKYTNFLYSIFCGIAGQPFTAFDIFLPVGLSFFTFQSMSYTIDIYRGEIRPVKRWIDFAFFVSFFPQLVAGPIVRAKDFIPQIYKSVMVTQQMFGTGVFLISTGLFKKAVISDYISSNFVDRIFEAPLLYSGLESLLAVYGYAIQIYCDFSGYSDMAIGIALLMGFHFNLNFNSPYKAINITDFWRRWHISLSTWLRDYLYISLGGNRKGKLRTYLNLLITMVLGGLWHGAAFRFILWGAIHGLALVVHKLFRSFFPKAEKEGGRSWLRNFAGILITFHLVALAWIPFRAANMQVVSDIMGQIFTRFHAEVLLDPKFMGYLPVLGLILLGYVLHYLPDSWEKNTRQAVVKAPLVVQALIITALIIIVFQVKSSEVQPFIYFQF